MTHKQCSSCGEVKPKSNFGTHRGCSGGVRPECKVCYNFAAKADKTKFILKMYRTQVASSKKRGHPDPAYTLEQFHDWVVKQPAFNGIWDTYQQSGQDKYLAPSADRVNPNLPYTLGNLELVTWGTNDKRGTASSMAGERLSQHKPVVGHGATGSIGPFVSLHEAARAVGGNPTNIQRVADGTIIKKPNGKTTILKSHKGYQWFWA